MVLLSNTIWYLIANYRWCKSSNLKEEYRLAWFRDYWDHRKSNFNLDYSWMRSKEIWHLTKNKCIGDEKISSILFITCLKPILNLPFLSRSCDIIYIFLMKIDWQTHFREEEKKNRISRFRIGYWHVMKYWNNFRIASIHSRF